MTPTLVEKIKQLVEDGATVMGPRQPHHRVSRIFRSATRKSFGWRAKSGAIAMAKT